MECTHVAHRSKPKENGSLQNSDNINKTVVTTSTGHRLPLGAAFIVQSPWGSVQSPELEGGLFCELPDTAGDWQLEQLIRHSREQTRSPYCFCD